MLPTALREWTARLSERLGDLECRSVVVSEGFDGGEASGPDEQLAFRTVIQLDGEILSSIHARALADPDFAGAHARHLARVGQILRAHIRQLERLARAATWGLAGLAGAVVYGSGACFELAEAVVDAAYAELLTLGVSLVVAALASVMGRALLRRWLPRLAARERLRRKHEALDAIAEIATSSASGGALERPVKPRPGRG